MSTPKLSKAAVRKALEQKLTALKDALKQYDHVKAEVLKRQEKSDLALAKAFGQCKTAAEFHELLHSSISPTGHYDRFSNKYTPVKPVEVSEEEGRIVDLFRNGNPQHKIAEIEMALQEVDLFEGDTLPASGNLTYLQLIRR